MIRNGDVELKAREEEIRFLKMEVTMKYFKSLTFVSMWVHLHVPFLKKLATSLIWCWPLSTDSLLNAKDDA